MACSTQLHGNPDRCCPKSLVAWPPEGSLGLSNGWMSLHCNVTVSRTFHSLCRVLCIFRSFYLFAIGLVPMFSLGRGISPGSDCSLKQSDSRNTSALFPLDPQPNGAVTLHGVPFQATCWVETSSGSPKHPNLAVLRLWFPSAARSCGWAHLRVSMFTRSY
jgi:hypothetical protein